MANAKLKEALVVAEMKLSYSIKVRALDRPQITCSKDAEQILRSKWGGNIELLEEFNVLFVDRQNRVKSFYNLSKGGTAATVVDPKILFAAGLKEMAAGIILAHNHPSGSLKPSDADLSLTSRFVQIGKLLEMPILDHIILAPDNGSYYSFADNGNI